MEHKYKLVIDTSLIVRSFISTRSYAALLIDKWYEEKFALLLSQETYHEAEEVLYRHYFMQKYEISKQAIELLLSDMSVRCLLIEPYPIAIESRDAKDTKFLHLALAGEADYLVSGDNDLLVLKNHPDIGSLKIVTEEQMLANL